MTHTKGPWKANPMPGLEPTSWIVEVAMPVGSALGFYTIAEVPATHSEAEADAKLIAAAPDLLEACQRNKALIESVIDRWPLSFLSLDGEAYNVLVNAIAKATQE